MDNQIARNLHAIEKKYENKGAFTGEVVIYMMARDAAGEIERLEAEVDRLRAELDAFKADIEAGRMVRLPVALGQHLWQEWNGEEWREWVVDSILIRQCGDYYVSCVDFVDGEYGEDYETFDAACLGHKLRFSQEAARAALEGGQQ